MHKFTELLEFIIVHITRKDNQSYDILLDKDDWLWVKEYRLHVVPNHSTFYVIIADANNKQWLLHRVLLNAPKGKVVDHENGIGLDNRRKNISITTYAENMQNRHGKVGVSGERGVCWHKGANKWQAYCTIEGTTFQLGNHDTVEIAAEIVKNFRATHMPFSKEARGLL